MKTPKGILNFYFLLSVFVSVTFISVSIIYSSLRQSLSHCVIKQLNNPCDDNEIRVYNDLSNFINIGNFVSVTTLLIAISILVGIELQHKKTQEEQP